MNTAHFSYLIEKLGGKIDNAEKAKDFFELFFSTQWWPNRSKMNRKPEFSVRATYLEFHRLRGEYTAVFEEFVTGKGWEKDFLI